MILFDRYNFSKLLQKFEFIWINVLFKDISTTHQYKVNYYYALLYVIICNYQKLPKISNTNNMFIFILKLLIGMNNNM